MSGGFVVVNVDIVSQDVPSPRQIAPNVIRTAVPAAQEDSFYKVEFYYVVVALVEECMCADIMDAACMPQINKCPEQGQSHT